MTKIILGSLTNLKSKTDEGKFLGYSLTSKAYRVLNLKTKTVIECIIVSIDDMAQMTSEQKFTRLKIDQVTSDAFQKFRDSEINLLFEKFFEDDDDSFDPPTVRAIA